MRGPHFFVLRVEISRKRLVGFVLATPLPRVVSEMKWVMVVLGIGMASVAADDFGDRAGAVRDESLEKAGFSNTAGWGKEFTEWTRKRTRFLPDDWKKRFQLVEPPANSSVRTRSEVVYLQSVSKQRTAKQQDIEKEVLITNFRFGEHRYEELIKDSRYKETGKLLEAAYLDLAVVTFVFKQRFDRIRPSVLASRLDLPLEPSIEIPAHPAYPSGHATGAYGLAYLLQEIDPANAGRYLEDARRIGENREIAGVHYPSDTEAGRVLARQVVDAFLSNPSFVQQLESARAEW